MELPCLVVLGAIVVLGHVVGSNGCFPEEKRALLDFKASYANETLLPSWLNYTDSNCCEWQGVSCLTSSSRVTGLSLWNFTRNWHSDFENHCYQYHRLNWSLFLPFKELRTLILSANCFDGFIQKEGLCKMMQLDELDLSRNHLRGTVDPCLGNLTSLWSLDLSYNLLTGTFPNWLLQNHSKRELYLSDNFFTGPFDPKHHTDHLSVLDLSNNQLQGKLPNNIGFFLSHLEYFDVSNNMFNGHIPASIGNMSNLGYLFLRDNELSGNVPEQFLNGCTSLNILMMDNNHLSGTLLSGIGKLSLRILTAARNNFEGAMTKENCQFSFEILDLRHNKFSGPIPSCFPIPLYYLFLQGNSFTGTTETLLNFSGMSAMDLSDNKFSGTIQIPYRLYNMRYLLLAGNQFHGQIPSQICELQTIDILDLSRNNFTGSIPPCLNNMSFGKTYFSSQYSQGYRLTPYSAIPDFTEVQLVTKGFSLSYKGATLEYMSGLDFSSNQFTGEIPHQIEDLFALHALNLSHNNLNGPIPQSFQKLESIESLDLSNNNLSGQIPVQLEDLHSLSVFNVSYNNLSGRAPEKGQFGTFGESSYKGNPYLTWSISNRGNATLSPIPTPLNDGNKNDSAIDFTSFYWSFAASFGTVLIMLATILWINPYWRRAWFYFIQVCLHKCFGQFIDNAFY